MDLVVRNSEKISDEQKPFVPIKSYNLANTYLDIKRDLARNTRNSAEEPQNDSKNK